jgi:hypothetical protein
MNIESIPKFFAPKGMHISDSGEQLPANNSP